MRKNLLFVALISLLALTQSACTEFYKLQRSTEWEKQFDAAMNYYAEEEYNKANILFEIILPIVRGSEKAEDVEFYYAYTYYQMRQYILSAHYFKKFHDTYRRSKYAEEALYMHAYSLYEQSPNVQLDQTPTQEAISALQLFLNRYPLSENRADASQIINELQQKLELKAFENARQYFTLSRYKAAIVAFNNFERDYPDSAYKEEGAFLKFSCQYEFAKNSLATKQRERYEEAIKFYQDLVDRYPQSEYVSRAENMYDNCLDALEDMNAGNNS